ncbi:hypothetical protein MBLNU459_g1634t2 [Dothideomycetes sp. NU459]
MNAYDTRLYPRVTGLKKTNANLKVFISVGGWAAGGAVFSNMVGTAATRATFISSAISFMNTYGFDGLDVDWEYPVAGDRGGAKADFQNYVSFLKELRAACGSKFGITLTLPSSYWYLQGFDVVNLEPYVDWFNFMSYDIHGTWDGTSPYTKAIVQPHTNLTEISQGLDLLWRNNIKPSKVVLGLGFYGRSFTLKDSSCNTPGCAFSGGGNPGNCTQTSGILSNAEIQRIIKAYSLTPVLDSQAGIKYITWNSNQWVSYDDEQTFTVKKNFANGLCLGGTMVWALDLDDPSTQQSVTNLNLDGLRSIGDNVDSNPTFASQKMRAIRKQNNVNLITFWTDCMKNPNCPGTNAGNALGAGLAPRVADVTKFQNKGIGSGSNIGTAMECVSEVFPGLAALGLTVAGIYILNSLPGYWQLVQGRYQWRPQRNIVYPQPSPQACTTTVTSISDMESDYPQWIRFLPFSENSGAGQIWRNLCDNKAKSSTNVQGGPASDQTCTEVNHITYTVKAMTMVFANMPPTNDDGLAANPCLPIITDDIGFALFTNDPWYGSSLGRGKNQYAYKDDPPSSLTNGKTAPRSWRNLAKRELDFADNMGSPDDIIVNEGNTTRKATDEELLEDFGLYRCTSQDCDKEREALQILGARQVPDAVPRTRAPSASATTSASAFHVDTDALVPLAVRTAGATKPLPSLDHPGSAVHAQQHVRSHMHRRGH